MFYPGAETGELGYKNGHLKTILNYPSRKLKSESSSENLTAGLTH
jgi:hypothetical protein